MRLLFAVLACTGCIATDPSGWRPDQHVAVLRTCRVACHPAAVKRYDSMDGSCECWGKKP